MISTSVQPERILKDLAKLWVDLGKQQEHGVLRACAMTLIFIAEETEDPNAIGEVLAGIMHEHPSRAIVLRVRNSTDEFLDARVFALCWMPFGRRQQICCEQVEITATRESLRDVPAVLRGITVPDLPVVICCPSVELCKRPEVTSLLPLADKLIVDSGSDGDSTAVLQYLNEIKRSKLLVSDLTWGRLTPLREAIAQIFENPVCLREAYNLESVNIQYKGREEPVSIYYFAGWFMHVLGAGVHLNIAKGVGPAYADITRIDLVGPDAKASLDVADGTAIDVEIDGTTQRVVLPELSVADLLRNELSIVGRDPIFEDALGLANLMWGPK